MSLQVAVDEVLRKRGGNQRLKYLTHVEFLQNFCLDVAGLKCGFPLLLQ